jgi:hypothetical protein
LCTYNPFQEFQPLFDEISAKRRSVVTGEYEPTDADAELPLLHGVPPEDLEVCNLIFALHANRNFLTKDKP